ncbi:hypothetical protein FHS27_001462 [Rhodopirellula rubra]|uniref:Uncharacterized protein n=1 Tax=Aporhodopirellula rubra TaxID=980271 RepID=A0A7W5H4Y9_9BACT|nr:hypothetical protein [Aporhodopirellula rubra]
MAWDEGILGGPPLLQQLKGHRRASQPILRDDVAAVLDVIP